MQTSKTKASDYPRSHEPIAWSLFGAGGMVVAFITPALVIIVALLIPLGIVDSQLLSYERVLGFLQTGWGALALLIVIGLQLYHAAHRIHHGLFDLHIKINTRLSACLFYGGATILNLLTVWLLVSTGMPDAF